MKGLTILEVLVAILIFSIIAMGLGYAVVAGKSALLVSDIPTQLRQNVLFAIMQMARELRQTAPDKTNLNAEAESNSITFKVVRYNKNAPVAGVLVWGPDITYACNGLGQLTRTSGGTTLVIAPNIVLPSPPVYLFSRKGIDEGLIKIDVNAQKADAQGNHVDREQAIVKMRN
jgi:prepilin-type N-terminal cleavage/methylation domain-containing protein